MPVLPQPGTPQSIQYYLSLITSQYQNSPKFLSWVQALLQMPDDAATCASTFLNEFDLDSAYGAQLDLLGEIVGVGRTVNFQPTGGVSPVLDDATYRIVLRAKIAKNSWNGKIDSLQALWQSMFPGGNIYILDGQNMSITVVLSGAFTSILQDLIMHDYIVPRPEAVLNNYIFVVTPVFGFDLNDAFISGFDLGHWS